MAEKLVFLLEGTYAARVSLAKTTAQALERLSDLESPVDLVVFDFRIGAVDEFKAFWGACKTIPVLLCVQGKKENAKTSANNIVGYVDRTRFTEDLGRAMGELFEKGTLKREMEEEESTSEAMVRIQTKLLLDVAPLKGDIYIKLSESKYVKLFHEGDTFDRGDMEKYTIRKGVEYLYIRGHQVKEFLDKYSSDLKALIANDALEMGDAFKVSQSIHETVQELGARVGFTKDVQALAKTQVQLTMKTMGKSPDLSQMLARLKAAEGKYIASHSILTGYIACAIATQMEWASEPTFHKLTLAAFLHDITITNHEVAAYETLEQLARDEKDLALADIQDFKSHPIKGAEIAKKFTEVPPDVDIIIMQHHEKPDSSGFPRKLSHTYISPLSCIFIIAHDLARTIILSGRMDVDLVAFLARVRPIYKSGLFRKVLAVLEKVELIQKMADSARASLQGPPAAKS